MEVDSPWTPPVYDLTNPPQRCTPVGGPFPAGDFPRSAKWCSDGSALLVHCEQRAFRVIHTPNTAPPAGASHTQTSFPQPAPIVDYAWYPHASASTPASFCFAASVREAPVKLLDASDGRLRASYPIVDHRERQIAPHSLAFDPSGTRLYCGFESAIEIFDVSRPGCEGTRVRMSASKKRKDGLKGIISALSFQPSSSSSPSSALLAVGSLSSPSSTGGSNIALFSSDLSTDPDPVIFLGGGPSAGVTQLLFNPAHPHILYASFRRHPGVYAWDIRADGSAPFVRYTLGTDASAREEKETPRKETNQRRRFDVDWAGRVLGCGDVNGHISLFDLSHSANPTQMDDSLAEGTTRQVNPTLTFPAHRDAIGGIAFHPFPNPDPQNINGRCGLVSVCGSRHFDEYSDDDDSGSASGSEDDSGGEGEESGVVSGMNKKRGSVRRPLRRRAPRVKEAGVSWWDLSSPSPSPAQVSPRAAT
uniref:WD40 repeat-like protein n=1 Tax=Mycena chlorophos TaxID=658473 RepID=A0ABQ0LPV2_MYCCL|nr:predicted protein [Mycena chlorophos]